MKLTLLIVSGGIEAIPGIQKAKELGVHVVVSDGNPEAPGFAWADDHLLASTYDIEQTVKAAKKYHRTKRPIDGVICIAADVPHTVAGVAERLKLPGISRESAHLATDKLAMKEAFARHGVPIPWFSEVQSADQLGRIVLSQGFPLVLKPVDSRGARGVVLLQEGVDLPWAFDYSRRQSPAHRVMIERFLEGPQVSTESLVVDDVIYTPGFSDRNYQYIERYAPNIIENGGEMPSFLSLEIQDEVKELVKKGARALGIKQGVVKGDIVISAGKPYIIELAARLSGGYFCSHSIPFNTGVDLVAAAIKQCLGLPVKGEDLIPKWQRGVCQRYLFPEPGVVCSIDGVEAVIESEGIRFCEIRTAVGERIGPIDSHPARAGVLMAVAETREQAISLAERAVQRISIKVR